MIKITIKPKDGSEPIVKSFHTPQESIAFINSYAGKSSSRPTQRAADANQSCGNFKKARDGKCYNCGFDKESHR